MAEAIRHFGEDGEAERLFRVFVKNHTVFDPTLAAWLSVTTDQLASDPHMRYVAASNRKAITPITPQDRQNYRDTFAEFLKIVGIAHRSGVTLITGTDIAGPRIPGFSLHDELALLVDCGLTPLEALQAATITPANVVGKANELGSIDRGKIADFVLLDANPLDDIHNTLNMQYVMKGGVLYDAGTLDEIWPKRVSWGPYYWVNPDALQMNDKSVDVFDKKP